MFFPFPGMIHSPSPLVGMIYSPSPLAGGGRGGGRRRSAASSDPEIRLITDNRNQDSPNSLEATIRGQNQPNSLPVFTMGDLSKFQNSGEYAERVLEQWYDYLLRIDEVRGTGRLYLP